MARARKKWELRNELDVVQRREHARLFGVSETMAGLLYNRGITDSENARMFLNPSVEHLTDPMSLPDMRRAATRILKALYAGEKVMIYGDYDVDGITATATMARCLGELGADIQSYIPKRLEEGYGINIEAIEQAASQGIKLIITVDCGIGAYDEVERAKELGIDVIITDHHQPGDGVPHCVAVVNPKLKPDGLGQDTLAGVGVAFKMCQAVHDLIGADDNSDPMRYIDLVALGTVADMVPLVGENRAIAYFGMQRMTQTENPGLASLLESCNLYGRQLSATNISYTIAPRLNAVGRLGDASVAVELFLTDDAPRAAEIATMLADENRKRQEIEAIISEQATCMIEEQDLSADNIIVLASEGWHQGVVGIVASRVVESYNRPAILISMSNGEGRGSGRSIGGFDLHAALTECADCLVRFGGHAQAAGLTLKTEMLEQFKDKINLVASQQIISSQLTPILKVDAVLRPQKLTLDLAHEISKLQPYGLSNPEPVFVTNKLEINDIRTVGADGRHLKLRLSRDGVYLNAIGYNMGSRMDDFEDDKNPVDIAYTMEVSRYNGNEYLQLVLRDIRHSPDVPRAN